MQNNGPRKRFDERQKESKYLPTYVPICLPKLLLRRRSVHCLLLRLLFKKGSHLCRDNHKRRQFWMWATKLGNGPLRRLSPKFPAITLVVVTFCDEMGNGRVNVGNEREDHFWGQWGRKERKRRRTWVTYCLGVGDPWNLPVTIRK